ncbi:putative cytochrome P450 [Rosa chinensis]|uniref:Putative cytochrome P450 n=1 Tax=Rosa chinensis TaxID=74649 RepID=A0A2P6PSX5_ROSCH|nr:putative cytochrome P450 [Rosa chinensis]
MHVDCGGSEFSCFATDRYVLLTGISNGGTSKCNGLLPPGSMGLPLIGAETLHFNKYIKIIEGLMPLPLNVPGTAYYNCTKGFTIPEGWMIVLVSSALHLSSNFKDPIEFNPWCWNLEGSVLGNSAEYCRVFLATFLHVLIITTYRWTIIKGVRIARTPMLGFGDGIQMKLSEKIYYSHHYCSSFCF